MQHQLITAPSLVLGRSIEFLARFPPCQGDVVLGADSIAGAFAIGGRAVAYRVTTGKPGALAVETADAKAVPLVAAFLGVDDDLTSFYERAAGDRPLAPILAMLHGLHHVRFRTLEEVTVHAVLGQRTPIALASKQKRHVAATLGPSVEIDGRSIVAFPTFDQLVGLDAADWLAILGNQAKARRMPSVVRGVAELGEDWLRTARYADAVVALQEIDGVGPFSAAMILLRGLGRMDDVPLEFPGIARVAEAVYGAAWDPVRIRARYGTDLGYWSFYLKAGAARLADPAPAVAARRRRSAARTG